MSSESWMYYIALNKLNFSLFDKVDKDYAKSLNKKREIFQTVTNTKKALFTTLISPYGAKENQYYQSVVQNQLTLNDLF